jgi:hypothetical protein
MRFRFKGFTSLLMACCFTVAAISGIVLYFTPRGRVANWTSWTMFGLEKHQWGSVHMNACLLVLIVAGIHLVLNWRVFLSYIKRKAAGLNLKAEMATALVITAVVVSGTVFELPPFSTIVAMNEAIKDRWERQAPRGPAPHAEEFSVARMAGNLGLTVDEVTLALRQEGLKVEDPDMSIGQLAHQSGIAPSDVYAAIQRRYPNATADPRPGRGQGRGLGLGRGGRGSGAGSDGQPSESTTAAPGLDEHPRGRGEGRGPGLGLGRGRGGWGQGQGMGLGQGLGPGRGQGRGLHEESPTSQDP